MLTDKQGLFCKEYIIDCNATQAAIRAGYSRKTAGASAARLLANVKVSARIAELMAEKDAALIAMADEVLKTLTRVLRREEAEQVVIKTSERVPTVGDDGKTRYTTRETPQVVDVKPYLSDVNRAAELLGKRYALWTDRVELDADLVRIIDDIPDVAPYG